MYAVIATGGKQYRVTEGDVLKIQKLTGDVGTNIDFNEVLMVGAGDEVKVGAPHVKGVKVVASIVAHGRDKKIHIIKIKRRKHHMKRMGHRQDFTQIKIEKIA